MRKLVLIAAVSILFTGFCYALPNDVDGLIIGWDFEDQAPGGITADVSGINTPMNATLTAPNLIVWDSDRNSYVLDPTANHWDQNPSSPTYGEFTPWVGGALANNQVKSEFDTSFTFQVWVKPMPNVFTGSCSYAINQSHFRFITGRADGYGPRMWAEVSSYSADSQLWYYCDSSSGRCSDWWAPIDIWRGTVWDPCDSHWDGTGPWHQLLFYFDGDKMYGYIDGTLYQTIDRIGTNIVGTRIPGDMGPWGLSAFGGQDSFWRIDDVAYWHGAWSSNPGESMDDVIKKLYSGVYNIHTAPIIAHKTITILTPNGGELASGSNFEVTWHATGIIANVKLEYSVDAGASWTKIGTVPNTGSYMWNVAKVNSRMCLIKISDADNSVLSDITNSTFRIYNNCPAWLIADLNGDCKVDLADMAVLAMQWLDCTQPGDPDCMP